jgi:acetaldehyde dehydrogenase
VLDPIAFVGVDPQSDGLAFAKKHGIWTTHEGLDGLVRWGRFAEIGVVFDATSAKAHEKHAPVLRAKGKHVVDMTPAAVGPYVVPVVNLASHARGEGAVNVNMTTCGGQATIPMVHAVARVAPVVYAEIVASIASKSAGPGTRANIDEFTVTTARAIEQVGGAQRGKAIIVLNPAEPPVIMRDTVYCFVAQRGEAVRAAIVESVARMVEDVRGYVPGYRLKQAPVFDDVALAIPGSMSAEGTKVTVFLEVEGAGHYLPKYAGNLDIMTSAAQRVGERLVTAG